MVDLHIRMASEEDRIDVLTFCKHTWHWGDYINDVWDRWLHDTSGILFVATLDNNKPVGIAHIRMMTRYDAWVQGLRVDPDYRHQGIALALNQARLSEALHRGARSLRGAISSTNTRAIQINEQGGMHRIGNFTTFFATIETIVPFQKRPASKRIQIALPADIHEILHFLHSSSIFPLSGGLYYIEWMAYPITIEILQAKIEAQQVYLLRSKNHLVALAIAEIWEDQQEHRLSVGYIDGSLEKIGQIAYDLCCLLPQGEVEQIRIYAPDMLEDVLIEGGYKRESALFYTYEQSL